MKAEDLMVGDWLRYNGSPYRVIQITCASIPDDEFYGWILENGVEDKGEPIPLTPEILEKNGFVLHEEEVVGIYGVKIAPNYTRDDLPFEIFCDGEPFAIWFRDPIDIAYVHQLQNFIRLCGVNQEIVL